MTPCGSGSSTASSTARSAERSPGHYAAAAPASAFGSTSVKTLPFPGEWPMTEAAIGVLRELDALGTEASAPPNAN